MHTCHISHCEIKSHKLRPICNNLCTCTSAYCVIYAKFFNMTQNLHYFDMTSIVLFLAGYTQRNLIFVFVATIAGFTLDFFFLSPSLLPIRYFFCANFLVWAIYRHFFASHINPMIKVIDMMNDSSVDSEKTCVNFRACSSVNSKRRVSYYYVALFILTNTYYRISYTVLCHTHFPTVINKINIPSVPFQCFGNGGRAL